MQNTFKGDLIGVWPQVNGETGGTFTSLSFRLKGRNIGSIAINDVKDADGKVTDNICDKVKVAFEEAAKEGKGLLFEVSNAILIPAVEDIEGEEVQVIGEDGTKYWRIVGAELGQAPKLKKVGTINRGGTVAEITL